MQKFITSFDKKNNYIYIWDLNVVNKIKNVLRAKSGYEFQIHKPFFYWELSNINVYTVILYEIKKDEIIAKITFCQKINILQKKSWYLVPILNNFDKMDLIVQKLTEIWIENIIFWKSSNSQIKNISDKKFEKFKKISIDAVQQSWMFALPKIKKIDNLLDFLEDISLCIFDFGGIDLINIEKSNFDKKNLWGICGPEWWFSNYDYSILEKFNYKKISLWNSVLRAETWIIVSSWILKNFIY